MPQLSEKEGHIVVKCKSKKCRVRGRFHQQLLHRYIVTDNSLALPLPSENFFPPPIQDHPSVPILCIHQRWKG